MASGRSGSEGIMAVWTRPRVGAETFAVNRTVEDAGGR
jgi:hypothetical protein